MIEALIAGQRDPKVLAQLAKGRMRIKISALEQALTGHFDDHHAFVCQIMLDNIDRLSTQIDNLTRIEELIAPFQHQVDQLDEIPGVGRIGAQDILAETGVDMTVFPTDAHLVSWAKFAPQIKESDPAAEFGSGGEREVEAFEAAGSAVLERVSGPPGV
jgi:transposase